MILIGYDIGSSSVKASMIDADNGKCLATAFYPKSEAPIIAKQSGWAEQEPQDWWSYLKQATKDCLAQVGATQAKEVAAIGISYQMHGLVCVDKQQQLLRPSIIWCDSRAVPYGEKAKNSLGSDYCLQHLLNFPGNFTAAKLAWVKENEPELFDKIDKIMLPGDYIAMRLTGEINTTVSGLSEGMFWDFKEGCINEALLRYFGFDSSILPQIVPTFAEQGRLLPHVAQELGLKANIPVTYRAGDQPNNAFSLNVINPGEVASTAGTSGVVYGVNGTVNYDALSRVNTFAHVNHTPQQTRLGVLLCINGTGILNAWVKRTVMSQEMTYQEMNQLAEKAPIGCEGLSILPFGNGAERILQNLETGCSINGLNFNIHRREHLARAAQEGIIFSFKYGLEIMEKMGMNFQKIHAGKANMFLNSVFRNALSTIADATIELYDTDGSAGAARGAGLGANIYRNTQEAFATLTKLIVIEPDGTQREAYNEAYERWKQYLQQYLNNK